MSVLLGRYDSVLTLLPATLAQLRRPDCTNGNRCSTGFPLSPIGPVPHHTPLRRGAVSTMEQFGHHQRLTAGPQYMTLDAAGIGWSIPPVDQNSHSLRGRQAVKSGSRPVINHQSRHGESV